MKHKNLNSYSRKTMIFARWSGKSNSVFLSLGKLIRISVLSVAYFLLNTFLAEAQTDTIKIEEIKISAYRTNMTFLNVPRMVNTIDADEISSAPVVSINDALKSVMNLDVRERGVFGIQSDLNIRGGSFEQNVVLINGVKMNDPQTGHFQMNLPIDMVDIKRIEVLSGSSSSLYGNNAFSGAINIITGLKEDNFAKVSLMAGEHALYGANVSLNLNTKKFQNYFSVSKKVSDGYMKDTDFDIFNLFYNGKITTKPGELQFQTGFLDKAFGAYSFYSPVYPNEYEQNKTWMANVKFESNTKVKIIPSIYWRRNFDKFELFRDSAPAWYVAPNYHTTDVYGAGLNTSFNTFLGQTALGVEWNTESIISNKLGDPLNDTLAIKGENIVKYTNGKTRQNTSIFFENQFEYKRVLVSARLMANLNSMFGWNFYPGIDISYKLNDKLRIFGSANWSGRIPSFTELYYSDPSNHGNVNLSPELAVTYEIGTRYIKNFMSIQADIFSRFGTNMIDWVKINPQDVWQCENLTKINTYGLEFSAKWDLKSQFGDQSFIKAVNFNYSYIAMDKSSGEYLSKYVLDFLKRNVSIGLTHQLLNNFTACWQFNYQYRNGTYLPYNQDNKAYDPEKSYTPIYLLDLKIMYQIRAIELYVQAKNIFNQEQQNIENVRLPGRWISGGLVLNVSFKQKK